MSVSIVYWISDARLKEQSVVHDNVNVEDLYPSMLKAQEEILQTITGRNFYLLLNSQVSAGITGGTAAYSPYYYELVEDYCIPLLVEATVFNYLPWAWSKIDNKGVLSGNADQGSTKTMTKTDIEYLRTIQWGHIENKRELLRAELNVNTWKYPDFASYNYQNLIYPVRSPNFSAGMIIPKRASATQNQQFGMPLDAQGVNYTLPSGIDRGLQLFGPISSR